MIRTDLDERQRLHRLRPDWVDIVRQPGARDEVRGYLQNDEVLGRYVRDLWSDLRQKLRDDLMVSAGVRNIFDNEYALAWGFPEPGRTFHIGMKGTF